MPDLTVFISYRRSDASADAGRLYDALRRRFGRENLFMDVDSLRPGEDWVDAVEGAVGRCDVLLAVIGPDWVSAVSGGGKRRLHEELDRVRLEIEAALRKGKPVIPVLVEGASMPSADDLPESLQPLLRRHAIRVAHATFDSDLHALVRALRTIEKSLQPSAPKAKPFVAPPPAPPSQETATTSADPTISPSLVPPVAVPPPEPIAPPSYPPAATPVYGYGQPVARTGPPVALVAALALAGVLVVGLLLMAALKVGPFAGIAQVSPTPSASQAVPSTPLTTVTPTTTLVPTPTLVSPTEQPTDTLAPGGTFPPEAFGVMLDVVPDDVINSCTEDHAGAVPRLRCLVATEDPSLSFEFWYAAFPDISGVYADYNGWLTAEDISRDEASCFALLVPCEEWYHPPDSAAPIGRVAGAIDGTDGLVYWTHDLTLIVGLGIVSLDSGHTQQTVFEYWRDHAGVLDFAAPPATYVVQAGDTLAAIAEQFGITVDELLGENPACAPEQIFVGTILYLPANAGLPTDWTPPAGGLSYCSP